MVILGLTGSIGMGKTTAAEAFRRFGVPVHDADHVVHKLLARGGAAVDAVGRLFPDAVKDGVVDREAVARAVFGDEAALDRIESVLHPLVRRAERKFLERCARDRRPLVVLNVPLLFETGGEARCDAVVTVSAPAFVQAQRVLRRPGMTPDRLAAILERQMPDAEKRRRSDFVVLTGLGRDFALRQVRNIFKITRQWKGAKWAPRDRRGETDVA